MIVVFSLLLITGYLSDNNGNNCTIKNSIFENEFSSLINTPFNYDKFTIVIPNKNRCEYLKMAPFSSFQTIYNFTCPKETCFRWCSSNTICNYSMFSQKDKICIRAVDMEISDNFRHSKAYFLKGFVSYRRNTVIPRYYSQRCNSYYTKQTCNEDKQCGWNKGKPGYNKESFILAHNWCGRIKCNR